MSYCVNCGVELEASRKSCPLCGVKVINPMQKDEPEETCTTFSHHMDELKAKDRIFWMKFITVLLAMPIITCIICNIIYDKQLTWSIYVIGGVFILWVISTSPFYFKHYSYIRMLCADMAGILIGLFIIEYQSPGNGWVFFVALPIVLYFFMAWMLIIALSRVKLINGLGIAAVFFISVALMMPLLEALLHIYAAQPVTLIWSWFVTAPCLSIAILLILLNKNKRFKQEMAKRLHF